MLVYLYWHSYYSSLYLISPKTCHTFDFVNNNIALIIHHESLCHLNCFSYLKVNLIIINVININLLYLSRLAIFIWSMNNMY